MPKGLAYPGFLLALIGGIILVITGGVSFLGVVISIPFRSAFSGILGDLGRDLFEVILGIISVIGSRFVGMLGWAIALIVIGLIAGGFGGLLVLVGGILGLVHYFYKR